MKANEFVKKFGWNKAWVCLSLCASPEDKWFQYKGELVCDQDFDDLVRLVESYELVESYGGLHGARHTLKLLVSSIEIGLYHVLEGINAELEIPRLKQAIADVESCQ